MDLPEMPYLPEMAYITRMHFARTAKSWWVRFVASHQQKMKIVKHKVFKDKDFIDGKEEALFFAQGWRDDTYRDLREQDIIKGYRNINGNGIPPVYRTPGAANKSGVVGVEKNDFHYRKNVEGTIYPVHVFTWKATWVQYYILKGKSIRRKSQKSFSIRKYGAAKAFENAVKHRKNMEQYLISAKHIGLRNKFLLEPPP